MGDSFRITQVLINLVGNYTKFTHEDFVEVCATSNERDDWKLELSFSVVIEYVKKGDEPTRSKT